MRYGRKMRDWQVKIYQERMPRVKMQVKEAPPPKPKLPEVGSKWKYMHNKDFGLFTVIEVDRGMRRVKLGWTHPYGVQGERAEWFPLFEFKGDGIFKEFKMENV